MRASRGPRSPALPVSAPSVGAPSVAAASTLSLTQSWIQDLNDAPCGVGQSSPVAFDDNGTTGVEFGDRQGEIYGLDLQTGSVLPGWGGVTTSPTTGSSQGCITGVGGTPASPAVQGVEVPGSPPVDSTASVDPINNNLYFGAGNAAEPEDGGTTPTRRPGARCGTRW